MDDLVVFENSQGKTVVLSNPQNTQYWELLGRYGFTAPEVDIHTQQYASGKTIYLGKTIQPRICGMNMIVRGSSSAERDKVFFDMLDVLLDADGDGEGKLILKRFDGVKVQLNCVYSSGMRIVEEYKKFHRFTLEFYAADPWFYFEQVYPITGMSASASVYNPFSENLYPEIYFDKSPGNNLYPYVYIRNETTSKSIPFEYITLNGHPVVYTDINIYTAPKERGIFGTKEYYDANLDLITIHNATIPELIINTSNLNFPIVSGVNAVSWVYLQNYTNAYLKIKKPFAGA